MRYFEEAGELLQLFEIDTGKPGAEDFACLCDLAALMLRFPQYGVTVADLAAVLMAQRKLSPLVFWSRMKRAIKPLIEAESATLRGLGVPGGHDGHARTCPELAHDIGCSLIDTISGDGDDAEVAARVARACGRAK